MGGKGSGGRRPGSGPKPKMQIVPPPVAANYVAPEFPPSASLGPDVREIWLKLAPLAIGRGTLTRDTEMSFELLCRNVALERVMAVDVGQVGGANHRGLIQRIDAELLRFDLSPNGKPHGAVDRPAEKPMSPLELLKARRAAMKVV